MHAYVLHKDAQNSESSKTCDTQNQQGNKVKVVHKLY